METIQRLTHHRTFLISQSKCFFRPISRTPILTRPAFILPRRTHSSAARAGWFLGLGEKKNSNMLPDIVKAGDPVLHEPAQEVRPEEIGSDRIQKIVDDMVQVMRKAPGVGLAAPQIGIPLRVKYNTDYKIVPNINSLLICNCNSLTHS